MIIKCNVKKVLSVYENKNIVRNKIKCHVEHSSNHLPGDITHFVIIYISNRYIKSL